MSFPRVNKWHILATVMAGGLCSQLDSSMLSVSIPNITTDFQTTIGIAQWVPSIYRLIIVSLLLPFGRLGDIKGHSKVYIWGLISFTVASSFAGLSQSVGMLIGLRVLQGIGASMTMSMGNAIITQAFGPAERGKAFGLYLASVGLATAIGPFVGGAVTQYVGWRFTFVIDVVIGLAAFLLARRVFIGAGSRPEMAGQSFDRTGAVTLFLFLLSLTVLINRIPSWGWVAMPSLGLMGSILVWGVAFFSTEFRVSQPMVKMRLFSILPFSLGNLAALLAFMAQHILYFLSPFYIQMVLRISPVITGLIVAAQSVTMLVFSPFTGSLSDRLGTKPLTLLGPAISCLALLLMTQLGAQNSPLDVAWRLSLFSLGMAVFQSPNNSAIMNSVPKTEVGVASAMMNVSRNMAWMMGTVIGATILSATLPTFQALQQETGLFVSSLRNAYFLGAAFSAAAALSVLIPRRRRATPSSERPQ